RLHFDELRYDQRQVDRVDAMATLADGRVRLTGEGAVQGGRAELDALGRPFDSTASYVLRRAALVGVDLGTLLGRPDFAGRVTLSVTGSGHIRGESRRGQARVDLARSRLGRLKISGGTAHLRLAEQHLSYDASVESNAGGFSAAGDATPAAGVPM